MNDKLGCYLENVKRAAIAGHTRPDGDCTGSCLALSSYIEKNYPDVSVDVYLEPVADVFHVLKNSEKIISDYSSDQTYDVFFSLDGSDKERLASAQKYFDSAKKTVCIDHHITNENYADENVVFPEASSTCEVLAGLMDMDYVDRDIAEALYVGILTDTGCFKHSNTSEATMQMVGKLISKGIRFSKLTDEVFYQKTYMQNQLLGCCLIESVLILSGKCIFSVADKKMMNFYQADSSDLEGVIDQLRVTKGVEVAILLKEIESMTYKISLRSNEIVNVAEIARRFGGGGHIRAAGCTMHGTKYDVINNLTGYIEEQLKNQ